MYLDAKLDGAPEENLLLVMQFIADAKEQLEMSMQPPPGEQPPPEMDMPAGPQMGAMPMADIPPPPGAPPGPPGSDNFVPPSPMDESPPPSL